MEPVFKNGEFSGSRHQAPMDSRGGTGGAEIGGFF